MNVVKSLGSACNNIVSNFLGQNVFQESKEEINKIFADILDYINDCNGFLRSIHESGAQFQALINADEVKSLSSLVEKVKRIQSVISRDNMKCVFFGRTSNGKSTVINAMLGDRILPADIGHTTSCFIDIRGTKESQGSMSIISSPGSDSLHVERKQIDSIRELARDVCSTKLPTDSLIRIDWSSQKCALLSEDVVILDSPGIDVDPNIDQCIDKYCLDADVFVLVVSSVATLTETEKAFFHKVSKKLSKPNVFILNNFWDKSAKKTDYVNQIRNKQRERCVNFLTEELQVCSKMEAEKRVFFVSAKEVLSVRCRKNESGSSDPNALTSPDSKPLREGCQSRLDEFETFEEFFGKTLSESATKTKFAAHSSEGLDIVGKVSNIMEALNEKGQKQRDRKSWRLKDMRIRCKKLATERSAAHEESTGDISRLLVKISNKVAKELQKEVLRLGDTIKEYNQKFSDEPEKLNKYKNNLIQHLENQLGNNMESLCGPDLCNQVDAVSTAILERYLALVQDADVAKEMHQSLCKDYAPDFDMELENKSSDFHEDLSFQGGWDLKKVMTGLCPAAALLAVPIPIAGISVFAAGCVASLLKYGYDYTTWTEKAKEETFKTQFVSYMAEKLKPEISQTSKYISREPRFALTTTLKRLDSIIERHGLKLQAEIAQLQRDMQRLEEITSKSQNHKNTAVELLKALKAFHDKYILAKS